MHERGLAHRPGRRRQTARNAYRSEFGEFSVQRVLDLGIRPFAFRKRDAMLFHFGDNRRYRAELDKPGDRVFLARDARPVELVRIDVADQSLQCFEVLEPCLDLVVVFDDSCCDD